MGTRSRIVSALFLTAVCIALRGGITNGMAADQPDSTNATGATFFVTFTPHEMTQNATPEKIAAAKTAKESRPAAQDMEGHWGPVVEGFQLSVRFEKESYKVGEPITASVFIRDAVQRPVAYRDFPMDFRGVKTDSPLCNLTILDEQHKPVPRLQREPQYVTDGPHRPMELNPGTQRKYEIKLDGRFNLSQPGKYFISAKRPVHKLMGDGYVDVSSGVATIQIVAVQP